MCQWLFAKLYDYIMKDAEEKILREWRGALLSNLSGDVLEIGCGTGVNLEFYPNGINRLVLAEPNPHMRKILDEKITHTTIKNIIVVPDSAESLSAANASFDAVVCTLVLCSVKNPAQVLSEINRVLRPQGKLIFIEHVAATNNPKRYRWQKRLEFLWKHIAAGCHLTRPTEAIIANSGLKIVDITHQSIRGVPPIVRPSIRGIAIKE